MSLVLHTYFRSSAAYRVRIAMNLKGLQAEQVFVHLTRNGGEQFAEDFRRLNPQALVPMLSDGDVRVTQSLAIIEYLDEVFPQCPLLPATPAVRATVRQLALSVACDIHPLNNLRVLKYLTGTLGVSEEGKSAWIANWITLGLEAYETQLAKRAQPSAFSVGVAPTLADCCLVPQVFSAQRFNVDLSRCPRVMEVFARCETLPAFVEARPSQQPDAE